MIQAAPHIPYEEPDLSAFQYIPKNRSTIPQPNSIIHQTTVLLLSAYSRTKRYLAQNTKCSMEISWQ